MPNIVQKPAGAFYNNGVYRRYKRYDWANGNPKFEAFHSTIGVAETETDWEIWKYTTDGMKEEGPIQGAVNTEAAIAALAWNI
jgi:hypothetical protein